MKKLKYLLIGLLVISLMGCESYFEECQNEVPTVNAGKDVTVERNQKITLNGIAKDSDGTIKSYVWKKGSKVLSKKASFKYTPTKVGKETLTLTVTDDGGATVSDELVLNVTMRAFIMKWKVTTDKKITIPTFEETEYDYSVDWGDGKKETHIKGDTSHIYTKSGEYVVKIAGKFPQIYFLKFEKIIYKIISIEQWGDIEWKSMQGAFYGTEGLSGNATDIPNSSKVTDMSEMFVGSSFNQNINNWDVSNVSNMNMMFYTSRFNQDISSWNISNVTDMTYMFGSAFYYRRGEFNQDISSWDVSKVTNMSSMFDNSKFNQDISGWDVSNVTNMREMLSYSKFSTKNYNELLKEWSKQNVQKNVSFSIESMYSPSMSEARAILIDGFGWNIYDRGIDLSNNISKYYYLEKGQAITIDVSKVKATSSPIISYRWTKDSKVISRELILNTDNLDVGINRVMLTLEDERGESITDIIHIKLDNKRVVKPLVLLFSLNDFNLTIPLKGEGYNYTIDWGDGKVDKNITKELTHIYDRKGTYFVEISGEFPRIYFKKENSDRSKLVSILQWGSGEWKSMEGAFYKCDLASGNAYDKAGLSKVTDMSYMFYGSQFNQDIGDWDVSNVTDMHNMFRGKYYVMDTAFKQNIGSWDVSNVTDMSHMFSESQFNQDISSWDVSSVVDMSSIFFTSAFNQNISNWDVSNVTNMELDVWWVV